MKWEELTGEELTQAAKDTGLCIVPVGTLEYHGPHLPLCTDPYCAEELAVRAAQREPAVVFPPHYYGQTNCSRAFPGALAVDPDLHTKLLGAVCDEVARNGFKKILLYNAHGGNLAWLTYFCQLSLYQRKPYSLYLTHTFLTASEEIKNICPAPGGHADEVETSLMLALAPHLVKMDCMPGPHPPMERMRHLEGAFAGIHWYANYPEHCAGDARGATVDKGRRLLKIYVDALTEMICTIKADTSVPGLEKEFFARVDETGDAKSERSSANSREAKREKRRRRHG